MLDDFAMAASDRNGDCLQTGFLYILPSSVEQY